jgi:hypothetical protein
MLKPAIATALFIRLDPNCRIDPILEYVPRGSMNTHKTSSADMELVSGRQAEPLRLGDKPGESG